MSRWRVTFWLDDQKEDELAIGQDVLALKKKRQFARVVKDGIRLIQSLRAGDTSVLKELFPLIVAQIEYEQMAQESDDGKDGINIRLEEIKKAQDEMRRMIIEQGAIQAPPANYPQMKQSGSGIGKLASVNLAMPILDDEDMPQMAVKLAPLTGKTNGANLLSSTLGLADDDQDTLVITKSTSNKSMADEVMSNMMGLLS